MLKTRTFVPVVVGEGRGVGLDAETKAKPVQYDGTELKIKL